MNIKNWLSSLFRNTDKVYINTYQNAETKIYIEMFSLFTVVEFIAGLLSKCQFKTFYDNSEVKGLEWYSLNIAPNKNQTAGQFWQEFWCKLLYYQEVLVIDFNGQKIIADDFNMTEYAVTDTIFTQVSRGDFIFHRNFKISDVFYLRYTNANINAFIKNIFDMYDKLTTEAENNYTKGEKGILEVGAVARGDKDFEKRFQTLMNENFKSYFKAKNAVLPLFNGYKYTPNGQATSYKSTEISDIKVIFDEAITRASQIYKVSPALFKGDIAGIKEALDLTLTACISPLAHIAEKEFTAKEFTREQVISGNRIFFIDTAHIKHIDIFDMATNIDKLIASGFASVNEIRESAGLTWINEKWADEHYMTKNYQTVKETKRSDN